MDYKSLEKFKKVYTEYYLLHPNGDALPKSKFYYLHRQWFFQNHIDLLLENIEKFHVEFYPKANKEIALYAGLLHDSGLVYKREDKSAKGHEDRSCEYAKLILFRHGFDAIFIKNVCEAIEATNKENVPNSQEGILVRNADAYSHLTSLHFFAKAYFSDELDGYIMWFTEKIESTFSKLTIAKLINEIEPLVKRYRFMIDLFNRHKKFVGFEHEPIINETG